MNDDLELANRSIRRGARLAQVGFPAFAIFLAWWLVVLAQGQDPVLPILLFVLAVVLTAVVFTVARRFSRFQLTAEGVHSSNGLTLPWNAITKADYLNGLLSLYDGAGRETRLAIMFATSQASVLAAIRARLPRGIQISNDPSPGSRAN